MEADLSRYHGLDLRDRWRTDSHGRRALTLRMIGVRVRRLPPDSATMRTLAGQQPWTVTDYLLADVYGALAGQAHPARPKSGPAGLDPQLERRRRAARARARERQRMIDAGEIT